MKNHWLDKCDESLDTVIFAVYSDEKIKICKDGKFWVDGSVVWEDVPLFERFVEWQSGTQEKTEESCNPFSKTQVVATTNDNLRIESHGNAIAFWGDNKLYLMLEMLAHRTAKGLWALRFEVYTAFRDWISSRVKIKPGGK